MLINGYARKKYQISYVVNDVVTSYKDCQEIYWQFLAKGKNKIPAKKVTGTITLPQNVSNIDALKVWGHGQLNGEINKINEKQVKFNLNHLSADSMLEVRIITEDKLFDVRENKIKKYRYLSTALNEEYKWAEEANNDTKVFNIIKNILIIIYISIVLIYIIKIRKCMKIINNKEMKSIEIDYFRDIPREENSTPAEAIYLYEFNKQRLDTEAIQQNAVSATILNLCLKKKISLKIDDSNNVHIKVINTPDKLKKDELAIYNLIKKVSKEEWVNIKELENYAHEEYYEYSKSINTLVNEARESLYKLGIIDKSKEDLYRKCKNAKDSYVTLKNIYMWLIINHIIMLIPEFRANIIAVFGISFQYTVGKILAIIFPIICLKLYDLKLKDKFKNKIAVLTQKGNEEKAQWKGLVKYMKEYSLLNEKTVPDLVTWEKYLVYATAFGIADEVINQMKTAYPEVFINEQWKDEKIADKYPVISFIIGPNNINNNNIYYNPINSVYDGISKAYKTSQTEIATRTSSSSGSGGRWELFRRWRRPEVVGGRNGRKIEKYLKKR